MEKSIRRNAGRSGKEPKRDRSGKQQIKQTGSGYSGFATDSIKRKQQLLYTPSYFNEESIYKKILTTDNLQKVYSEYDYKIEPATDDKPFFSHKFRWASLSWASFLDTFRTKENLWGNLELKPIAEYVLIIILIQTILIAGILILLPLFITTRGGLSLQKSLPILLYFSCLGLGFIMIEMALLQKYQLYIGQPIYTYAIILGSILVTSGLGSYFSDKMTARYKNSLMIIIPSLLTLLFLYYLVIPLLFEYTLNLPLPIRLTIATISIFPLGFILGMPFPTGMARLQGSNHLIPWAWGVNSFFTVIGTTAALILGMALGFSLVLLFAGICYLVALMAMSRFLRTITNNK